MTYTHSFGGSWTKEKLEAIYGYVKAYHTIFSKSAASWYHSIYIDAFAGTGSVGLQAASSGQLIEEASTDIELVEGSAALALQLSPGFDKYLFIDQDARHVAELARLIKHFPDKQPKSQIRQGDANEILQEVTANWDAKRQRGLVILDPYGMSVDWQTLKALADTKSCDVMILFPLGQAVNRMLTRRGLPMKSWQDKLTRFFGSEEWKEVLYRKEHQDTLFGTEEYVYKAADLQDIQSYFTSRLESIFCTVSNEPLELVNTTGCKIFLLYIVSNNPNPKPKS